MKKPKTAITIGMMRNGQGVCLAFKLPNPMIKNIARKPNQIAGKIRL